MGYNLLMWYSGVITHWSQTFDPKFQRDIQVGDYTTHLYNFYNSNYRDPYQQTSNEM